MHESNYHKIFWGLIFNFVNINIGPLDILPNLIGFSLILSGLDGLSSLHSSFQKGKLPAFILLLTSIADFFIAKVNFLNGPLPPDAFGSLIYGGFCQLLFLYLIYCLCNGICFDAENKKADALRESSRIRWKAYLYTSAFTLFYIPFLINLPEAWMTLYSAAVIINMIAMLFIIGLVGTARKELMGEPEEE